MNAEHAAFISKAPTFFKENPQIASEVLNIITKYAPDQVGKELALKFANVPGMKTSEKNFNANQRHVKAVDNIRRSGGATKDQLKRMFNQLNNY